ncbi:DUF6504 family protein [Thermomonospora cellulosilytica]|uniref:DUF6504 domain-containing protein n=1 Tax=Thermomonospora cellulosilytica TaxID=1411118 RepID=A0A7W3R8X5_9ACTN|nr:DUF6504 family protein [Thermomonospora cellulosilytica]MBA9004049.1 hypothetical protein [Thermomonospora cellulosilytica]
MARVFGDPVQVAVCGGRPVRFVWRDRPYRVLRVLEHWVTTRDWWREQHTGDPFWENPGEREFWRVEATPAEEVGVYELRHEPSGDAWTLSRMWD